MHELEKHGVERESAEQENVSDELHRGGSNLARFSSFTFPAEKNKQAPNQTKYPFLIKHSFHLTFFFFLYYRLR
ncbi:hypothetical protein, partial [Lactococcus ileimucosae]|uniref:hypothetical protein n=1 Tax=Lactococcus ileimucosae TaxID=2941329 RepID=UPI0035182150